MQLQFFQKAFVYILIGFLPVAANFFLAPVYTKFLAPEEYALIGTAILFQSFLTFFLSLSLDGAFSRLYFDYDKDPKQKNTLLSTLLLTVTVLSVLLFVVFLLIGNTLMDLFFKNPNFRFSNYGIWIYLTTFANVVFLFFILLYRNEERTSAFFKANLSFFFVPVAGTLCGLIVLDGGAKGAITGRAVSSLLVLAVLICNWYSDKPVSFNRAYLGRSLRYSLPLLPYQLMFAAFSNIDRIIIERFFSAHTFGVYNFAVLLSGMIAVFINALNNAIYPSIYKELSEDHQSANVQSLNTTSFLIIGSVICLCASLVVPFMRLFINEEYSSSYEYVATLFLSYFPYVHYLIFTIPLFYFSRTKAFPVISFFALAGGIVFNLLLVPLLGIWAVCFSLYIIRVVQMGIVYLFLRRYHYHHYPYANQSRAFLVSLVLIVAYNIMLFVHLKYELLTIDIVNMVPLFCFVCTSLICFRYELKDLVERMPWKLYKKTA